jgi:hypothetical protein
MPITVTKVIPVRDVRRGDVLPNVAGNNVVADIEQKQTWAYILFEGEQTDARRMRRDINVTVLREERTAEEIAAVKHEFIVEALRDQLRKLLAGDPASMLRALLDKHIDGNDDLLTYYNLSDVLKAQAMYKQGSAIRYLIHTRTDALGHPADVNTADDVKTVHEDVLLDAYAMWYHTNFEKRHSSFTPDPLSRSTSVLSNVIDDVDRWAINKIVGGFEWSYGALDEVTQRLAVLKEKAENS